MRSHEKKKITSFRKPSMWNDTERNILHSRQYLWASTGFPRHGHKCRMFRKVSVDIGLKGERSCNLSIIIAFLPMVWVFSVFSIKKKLKIGNVNSWIVLRECFIYKNKAAFFFSLSRLSSDVEMTSKGLSRRATSPARLNADWSHARLLLSFLFVLHFVYRFLMHTTVLSNGSITDQVG